MPTRSLLKVTKMAGRKTKYTPETVKAITDTLASGATIKDACANAGIGQDTYFRWFNEKSEFSELVTRAQGRARLMATLAIRSAIQGAKQTSVTTESLTETRLRKGPQGEQVPYEYSKSARSQTTTDLPPDWRASIEYLKRRDPSEWSEKLQVNIDINIVVQLVEALRAIGENPDDVFTRLIEAAKQRVRTD